MVGWFSRWVSKHFPPHWKEIIAVMIHSAVSWMDLKKSFSAKRLMGERELLKLLKRRDFCGDNKLASLWIWAGQIERNHSDSANQNFSMSDMEKKEDKMLEAVCMTDRTIVCGRKKIFSHNELYRVLRFCIANFLTSCPWIVTETTCRSFNIDVSNLQPRI